ncbi:MAG TPA: hypothetical protein VLT36_06675 [Candidatus Dormibacteraeota bacterium]|nr:hypothetical protein [Candidatus Dormibacteraeota bacterium]
MLTSYDQAGRSGISHKAVSEARLAAAATAQDPRLENSNVQWPGEVFLKRKCAWLSATLRVRAIKPLAIAPALLELGIKMRFGKLGKHRSDHLNQSQKPPI